MHRLMGDSVIAEGGSSTTPLAAVQLLTERFLPLPNVLMKESENIQYVSCGWIMCIPYYWTATCVCAQGSHDGDNHHSGEGPKNPEPPTSSMLLRSLCNYKRITFYRVTFAVMVGWFFLEVGSLFWGCHLCAHSRVCFLGSPMLCRMIF